MRAPPSSPLMLRARGYTLIELIVVLAILGVLSSIALPLSEMTVQREKERELRRALWEIRDSLDAYRRARESGAIGLGTSASPYPPNLEALLVAYPDVRPGKQGEFIRLLRRIPRDPFAAVQLPASKTWGLRSYASEVNDPREGADVFDIYSLSKAKGLNGIALREW